MNMSQNQGMDTVGGTKQIARQHIVAKIMASNLLSATNEEVLSIINEQLEKNIALESDDPIGDVDDKDASAREEEEPTDGSVLDSVDGAAEGQTSDEDRSDGEKIDSVMLSDDGDTSGSDVVGVRSAGDDDEGQEFSTVSEGMTFGEYLKQQVAELDIDAEERFLANYLIDSLDETGYLTTPLAQIVDDLEFSEGHPTTEEDLEAVLVEVLQQELDPAGVFARNLQECVKLQIERMKGRYARYAYMIADKYFDLLIDHRTDLIEQVLGITNHQDLINVMRVFKHVNPRPGGSVREASKGGESQFVNPDFTVRSVDDQFVVSLNDRMMPAVYVSQTAQDELSRLESVKNRSEDVKKGIDMYKSSINQARSFVDALNRRRETLLKVMQTIVSMQTSFFKIGEKDMLRPMTQKKVAERTGYDISTISRVCNEKWVDTDNGYFMLGDLFVHELTGGAGDQEGVSSEVIRQAIKDVIEKEDKSKPLSDEAILNELKKNGFDSISRRTVAKYRMKLGIPSHRERKSLI